MKPAVCVLAKRAPEVPGPQMPIGDELHRPSQSGLHAGSAPKPPEVHSRRQRASDLKTSASRQEPADGQTTGPVWSTQAACPTQAKKAGKEHVGGRPGNRQPRRQEPSPDARRQGNATYRNPSRRASDLKNLRLQTVSASRQTSGRIGRELQGATAPDGSRAMVVGSGG